MKTLWIAIAATLLALLLGSYLFVASGVYDVGADRPHTAWVYSLLTLLRDRSIASHARDIKVPPLDDRGRIAEGAEHYSGMCVGCHLAPGEPDTEIRRGLLPQPPDLRRKRIEPAQAFWVIKHGIKATAMPAWGTTHDDEEIWNIVAFVQQLPTMSVEQYRAATTRSTEESDSAHAADEVKEHHAPAQEHDHEHQAHEH